MNVKYSISILALNGLDMTKRCIEVAIANAGTQDFELLLVDNGTTDGTKSYFESLATMLPNVTVNHCNKNSGFIKPNNIHAKFFARGQYFVCLNNDVLVPKDWLLKLEEPFKQFPTAAISGPRGICSALPGPYPSFNGAMGPLEYIEASCMMVPTDQARVSWLFDPGFTMAYGEDVDLSLRMRSRGKTIHNADFTISHKNGTSSNQVPDLWKFKQHNHARLLKKWGNYLQFRRLDLPIIVRRRGAIGDVVLTIPILRALRDQHPQSEIFVETSIPEALEDCPHITKAGYAFPEVYKWARIIELDMSYENMPSMHICEAYAEEACICPSPMRWLTDSVPERTIEMSQTCRTVAVHADKSWPGKTWDPKNWEDLIKQLQIEGAKVTLVGKGTDPLPCDMDLRNKTSLTDLKKFLATQDLFVGIDSAPFHLAQMVNTPVVGLFGATNPEYITTNSSYCASIYAGAFGIPCAGDRHKIPGRTYVSCDGACMKSISVKAVKDAIRQIYPANFRPRIRGKRAKMKPGRKKP